MRNKAARLLLIGALVCAPVPVAAQTPSGPDANPAETAKSVLAATLAYLAGTAQGPRATCVIAETTGPLQSERDRAPLMKVAEEAAAEAAAASGAGATPPDPSSRWLQPFSPARATDTGQPVAPALGRHLDAQLEAALHASASPRVPRIDPNMVLAPLRTELAARDCQTLRLSSPAFAGDIAFVETAENCGYSCGHGTLYALQPRDGRWAIVATADTWVN